LGGASGKNYFIDSGIFKNITSFDVNEFDLTIGQKFSATYYKKGEIFGERVTQVCEKDDRVIKSFLFKFSHPPSEPRTINKKNLTPFELITKTSFSNQNGYLNIVLHTANYQVTYPLGILCSYTGFSYAEILSLNYEAYLYAIKDAKNFDWEGNFFIRLTKGFFEKISDQGYIKAFGEFIEKKLRPQ
jgi:hypothetical protein